MVPPYCMPELVIGGREAESLIRNGFRPRDLGINMKTKFYPGVSLTGTEIRYVPCARKAKACCTLQSMRFRSCEQVLHENAVLSEIVNLFRRSLG